MAPLGRCRSLLTLRCRVCAGLSARPFFAARHKVMLQLLRAATHCRDTWVRRLQAPARMRPPLGDHFLMYCYPRHLEGRGGRHSCHTPGGPRGRRPRAFPPRLRGAAARRERAATLRARFAWSMGHHRALGAEAWAGASAAAAEPDMRGMPTPRRARVARRPRLGSHRASKWWCPRTGALGRRRYPPGSAGPAPPAKPSQSRAPRRLAGDPPKDAGGSPPLSPGARGL